MQWLPLTHQHPQNAKFAWSNNIIFYCQMQSKLVFLNCVSSKSFFIDHCKTFPYCKDFLQSSICLKHALWITEFDATSGRTRSSRAHIDFEMYVNRLVSKGTWSLRFWQNCLKFLFSRFCLQTNAFPVKKVVVVT